MKVVKVYGALRERLGQCRFEFDVATPVQAIRALCVNFPGLDKWLIDSEKDGVAYRVKVGKEQATTDDISVLALPWSEREVFSITPVVAGAGGWGRVLFGALLIGASFVTFGGSTLFAGGLGQGLGATSLVGSVGSGALYAGAGSAALGLLGAGLVLGGVAQIISPTPPSGLELEEANRIENFSFSGITNTSQQGLAVPIAYGRVVVGSAVISSGFDVDHSPNETTHPALTGLPVSMRKKYGAVFEANGL